MKRKKPKKTLGDAIKRARTDKGWTQLELAHAIGYEGEDAGAHICRLEGNQHCPRIDTLQRIANALKVPVGTLIA